MGERVYITKLDHIVNKVKDLNITGIEIIEIPCNAHDVSITFNNGSKLVVDDTLCVSLLEAHP